jgi:hypothetical protein
LQNENHSIPVAKLGRALTLFALAVVPIGAVAMPCTNMTLVLAIDGSGSISDEEFTLQLGATARAIVDPDVVDAMAGLGGVAVAAVIWGDAAFGIQTVDWVRIADHASAAVFAATLATQERRVSGNTDMGNGINAALDLIDNPDNCAAYNVIDVSGDGRETQNSNQRSPSLALARHRAEEAGVVINGLAISVSDVALQDYYQDHVIAGTGAFVIEAISFSAFEDAMRRKLLREVTGFSFPLTAEVELEAGQETLMHLNKALR